MANPTCKKCSLCCNDVSVEIDKPVDFDDFETIKWMIAHENVKVYLDNEGEWLVEFATKCKNLSAEKMCKVYSKRFPVCRDHDPTECIVHGEGEFFQEMFEKEDDVDKYMKKIGFYKEYMKKKKEMMGEKQ
jgi:hypothetical protein